MPDCRLGDGEEADKKRCIRQPKHVEDVEEKEEGNVQDLDLLRSNYTLSFN
jgi:hypothetical protein